MTKLFLVLLATASLSAHAAPLALEGSFHLTSSDVPGLCPEKLVVKAELDPETDQPAMVLVWDARILETGGAPDIFFAPALTFLDGDHDPGTYTRTKTSITDDYAENYRETCIDGECRGQGYTWMKVAHTHGGDQLEYYNHLHCRFKRD